MEPQAKVNFVSVIAVGSASYRPSGRALNSTQNQRIEDYLLHPESTRIYL